MCKLLRINIYLAFICLLLHLLVYIGLLRLSLNKAYTKILAPNKLKSNKIKVNFSFRPPFRNLFVFAEYIYIFFVLLVFRICQSCFITSAFVVVVFFLNIFICVVATAPKFANYNDIIVSLKFEVMANDVIR